MSEPLPTLRVLGTPTLVGPDGEPINFRTRKHFALLIYLALEPQLHRREKLGALLWPGATTSEARHSLATGLSVLRAKLGRDKVETARDTARLVPGSVELDLDRLARGEIHATETQPALAVAPLLHEFVVADAAPWDRWRDGLVAKWTPAIKDALLARIDRSRRQGNTRVMEVLADALLTLDDLSEEGVRAKMESRAFAGDRLSALQVYEDWRVRLADELGAQPSDLVAGMALRLRRRGWERTSGEHIPAVRTDQWKDRHFVGRAKEYEALYTGWEGCQEGTPRHVLLTGESGIGKSTLMERLVTAAGLQGAVSARVQCHEVEREIPYGAIGALIGLLLDRPGATGVAPEWLGELARTVSAVRRRFPHAAPTVEATGEMVRIRLADAFHELVRAIAEEQPLVLMMDDIHLGDDASVAVMHLLLRRLTDERVLVLCTLRQTEGSLAPSARGMLERAEIANMSVVPVPPLTEAEASELLGHLLPAETAPPPATVRRALLRAASGLPMLLELLVRDWQGHGDRCVALAVQAMTEEPGAEGGAGETYRRLLDRLTTGLDPVSRSVINLAAILGSQLNEFELYSLVDLSFAQAMAGLSQLAALRILRDGGHGLEFANEVMRGEAYLAVPSSVRKALHSKVADRLIQRSKDGEEMLGLAIAWHCVRSGRVDDAALWIVLGGKEAIARSALGVAEEALTSALKYLPSPANHESGLLLVEVLIDQARFQEAHDLAATLGTADPSALLARSSVLCELAALALTPPSESDRDSAIQKLLTISVDTTRSDLRLRALAVTAHLISLDPSADGAGMLLNVLDATRPRAPSHHLKRLDLLKAQALFWQRRLPECEAILVELSHGGSGDGPALLRYNLHLGLGACRAARGAYATSGECARLAADIARKAGAPSRESKALGNLAIVQFRIGELLEASEAAKHSLALADTFPVDVSTFGALGVQLCCSALSGDSAGFSAARARMHRELERPLVPTLQANGRLWLADSLLLAGEMTNAHNEAARAFELTRTPPISSLGQWSRWASNITQRNASSWSSEILAYCVQNIDGADTLDQYEMALACGQMLAPADRTKSRLAEIEMSALSRLPTFATSLARRLLLRGSRVA